MKFIKKVSVADLNSNTGTIINSMTSGDDQTVNAPSIHAVKDYLEDTIENYSTTEQKIGTWIDGKPLYRKVINFNDSHTSTFSIDVSNLNISQLVKLDGIMNEGSYGWIPLGIFWNQKYSMPQITNDTLYLNINGITVSSGCFILEYTKTID